MATILVVDDELLVLDSLKATLEDLGHVVLVATDGIEAMRLLRYRPQLALVDLVMPKVDGIEVIAALRQISPAISVVAMTGVQYADFDPLEAAMKLGAHAALKKPLMPGELAAVVLRLTADSKWATLR
jgi:CheY-like chemotaxis protein